MKSIRNRFSGRATVVAALLASYALAIPAQTPPPAPPDTTPRLRADEKWREARKAAPQVGRETNRPSQVAAKPNTRKDTGLLIARFKDQKAQRPVDVKADEVLVKFRETATDAEKGRALSLVKGTPTPRKIKALQRIRYQRVRVPDGVTIEDFLAQLRKLPSIEIAEANPILRSQAAKPEDPSFGGQWALEAIHAAEAWKITQGNPSIIIAVVDSGVDLDHPALTPSLVPGYDFVGDTTNADDEFGHGTQVAGIITAKPYGGTGISGVAPGCRVMPLKVLDANGEGAAGDVAEAIIYAADNGCRVINLSLGTYASCEALKEAVDYAASKNLIVVAAAGNNGTAEPCYPAAYAPTIAVAPVDRFQKPCFFGNRAPYIDVSGPGQDVLTTTLGGGYSDLTGSSAAAAHVSGVAGLLVAASPSMTRELVQAVIRGSAKDLGVSGWDSETGFGLVDCLAALQERSASERDLGIVSLTGLPQAPLPGQEVNVRAIVRNHGPISSETVSLFAREAGHVVWQTNLQVLAVKEEIALSFPWTPASNLANRTSVLAVELSPCSGESLLADNQRFVTVTNTSEPIHDVAIISAWPQGAPLEPGNLVPVGVEVANLGNQDEHGVTIEGFCEKELFRSERIAQLPAGKRMVVSVAWMCPDYVPSPEEDAPLYRLRFKTPLAQSETVITNNIFELRLGHSETASCVIPFHKVGSGTEVHQWIATNGYAYFASLVEGADIGTNIGTISGSFTVNNNDFIEGTYAEDQANRDPLLQTGNLYDEPFNRHFVAGADGSEIYDGFGTIIDYDSAYEQALNIWNNHTLGQYPANKALAFYRLGHVAHLLTDMTVPAHTHNDAHLPTDTDYFEETSVVGSPPNYKNRYYGGGRANGWWNRDMTLFGDLYTLFYYTANYTEDYDSNDEDGDVRRGSAAYNPSDYWDTWHLPSNVNRNDGFVLSEFTTMADDLMPYAMCRVAELIRLFYYIKDTSAPSVSMTYPSSENVDSPTIHNSLSAFNLTASASDSQSGFLKKGFQYKWSYWTAGTGWSSWHDVSPSPAGTNVSFTPSQGETWYCYYVIGENGGGLQTDTWDNRKYLRVILPPQAPTGVSATHGTYCSYVNVTWDAGSGVNGYDVYRDGSYVDSTDSTSYDDYPGNTSTYSYTIVAYNDGGESPPSSADLGWANATPSAPGSVSASDGAHTDKVRVTWGAASRATSYEVWRSTSNNSGSATKISNPDPTGTAYDDATAVAGTSYYYWIKSTNGCGTSGFSGSDDGYRQPALIIVMVRTSPPGLSFSVDGTNYTTAQTFSWTSGANHTIATTSPQGGGAGTQYVWSNWSDAGAIFHTIAPTTATDYTANFTTQYYLTMNAGAVGTVAPSSGWYNSATNVPITATPNTGYSFSSWAGSGSGSYSGSSSSASVTMNGPITETASFVPQTRVIGLSGNLAFGHVVTNTTATRTMTITNSGNSALTVSNIIYPSGFSGLWSGTIPAKASTNVTVTFTPTAVQAYGGLITVTNNSTSGTNTITASGYGRSVVGPIQELVNNAAPGATVVVPAGTFADNVVIAKDLTLKGAGRELTIIDGDQMGRVFTILSNISVTLCDLTVQGGRAPDGADALSPGERPAEAGEPGGGIYTEGDLTISNCVVQGNQSGNGGTSHDSDFPGADGGDGGGIYAAIGAYLEVIDCVVSNNATGSGGAADSRYDGGCGGDGGGIWCDSAVIERTCIISNRTGAGGRAYTSAGGSGGNGAGISCAGALIRDSVIQSNSTGTGGDSFADGSPATGSGGKGGGVYCCGETVVQRCMISANTTGTGGCNYEWGGGKGGDGGGVYASEGSPVFSLCEFVGNDTGDGGEGADPAGGNGGDGAGLAAAQACIPTVNACSFLTNITGNGGIDYGNNWTHGSGGSGGRGGAVFCFSGSISNSIFVGNRTGNGGAGCCGGAEYFSEDGGPGGDGGGLYLAGATMIRNCLFISNSTGNGAAGQSGSIPGLAQSGRGGDGAGIWSAGAQVANCTIWGNTLGLGAPGDLPGADGIGGGLWGTNATVVNSIFWNNDGLEIAGGGVQAAYSDIEWGTGQPWFDAATCLDMDPAFADPSPGNWRLTAVSPCIDAGTNQGWMSGAVDLDGNPRIVNGTVDIGAFEFVHLPPTIVVSPQNQTVSVGGTATFNVTASGTLPLLYQWRFYGTNLVGRTGTTLSLNNVQANQAGPYTVVVTNVGGAVTSTVATLTVLVPPAIVSQPQSRTDLVGTSASFSVTASGTAPLAYQWRFNGTNLVGRTGTTLSLSNVQTNQAGPYTVLVTNAIGAVTSTVATLTVLMPPAPVSGSVVAWGGNANGQSSVPSDLTDVVAVAGGVYHSLALKTGGTVVGWGLNSNGQTNPPVGLSNVTAIAAGWATSFALKRDGTLEEWGWDGGYGLKATAETLTNIISVSALWDCGVVLKGDNTVFVWGKSNYGETNVPAGLADVVAVSGGGRFCIAQKRDGTVVVWGSNYGGQTNVPAGLGSVAAIAAGGNHCLVLKSNGTVVAWGDNGYGQTNVPPDLTNAVAVSAGYYHSLALRADGTLVAWGRSNLGQTNLPPCLHSVIAISAGGYHNLAVVAGFYPMRFSGVDCLPNGQARLTVDGLAGDVYRVLGSTNLLDWLAIGTVTNTTGTVPFTDTSATSFSRRFYRLVMP